MLTVRNVIKTYPAVPRPVQAVQKVSVEVAAGSFLAVIGRSGSGKSTLLGMMGGLSRPTQGTVTLDGVDVWSLGDDARTELRRQKIGCVFQFASLLPTLRAIDNVALPALIGGTGDALAAYARADVLLRRVGLGDRTDAYPGTLSGGEQRRVALARSLINTPALLLADEPTGDLDEQTEADILDLLLDFQHSDNLTLVIVTHNLGIAKRADQVIEMRQGRIAAMQIPTEAHPRPFRAPPRPVCPGLDESAQAVLMAPVAVRLGAGLRRFLARFASWALLTALMIVGVNQAVALYQHQRIDQTQQARQALEETALSRLRADIEDVTPGPDRSFRLTLYLWNVTGDSPIYVLTPSVRAYVQVGPLWQEVPLRSTDGLDGRVIEVTGKQKYTYVFDPDVKKFEELLSGYMHVRFTNAMLVSQRSEPEDDLVERTDNYYVYLKPSGADDAAILRKMKFPGKPPLWIPMPPH